MNKFILAAALSLATVGAASASTLSTGTDAQVRALVPGADTSSITATQAVAIESIIVNGGDDFSNMIDRANAVRQVLNRG